MRISDFFRVPTIIDINQTGDRDRPYQASCPENDFRGRPTRTIRESQEQQTQHWARGHYGFDAEGWGAGWHDGFYS